MHLRQGSFKVKIKGNLISFRCLGRKNLRRLWLISGRLFWILSPVYLDFLLFKFFSWFLVQVVNYCQSCCSSCFLQGLLMFYISDIYLRETHKAVQVVDLLLASIIRTLILPMCFTAFQAPRIFINDVCRGQSIWNFIFILWLVGLVPFLELPFEWRSRCLGLGLFKSNDPVHHFFLILHDAIHGSLYLTDTGAEIWSRLNIVYHFLLGVYSPPRVSKGLNLGWKEISFYLGSELLGFLNGLGVFVSKKIP